MKKLATLTAAIALAAVFGFAGPAKADKPVDGKHHHAYFEATFVEFDGTDEVQVEGAYVSLGQDGYYTVSIPLNIVGTAVSYDVCLDSSPTLDGVFTELLLEQVSVQPGDKDLLVYGYLPGSFDGIDIVGIALRVRLSGSLGAASCAGTVKFETGLDLN